MLFFRFLTFTLRYLVAAYESTTYTMTCEGNTIRLERISNVRVYSQHSSYSETKHRYLGVERWTMLDSEIIHTKL